MSWKLYYEGVNFINSVSGTREEAQLRLEDWKREALPLVWKTVDSERASVYS
jgi:hypothetical protein